MEHALKNMELNRYLPLFGALQKLIQTNDPVIVEVGGHLGEDTVRFLHTFPTTRVYSFEPDPRNLDVLRHLVQHDVRVRVIPKAVLDHNGTTVFYKHVALKVPPQPKYGYVDAVQYQSQGLGASGSSSVRAVSDVKPHVSVEETRVECCSLDSELHDVAHVDLLWIDVQGAEKTVIEGATRLLRHTRFVWMEYGEIQYEQAMTREQTVELMRLHGFQEHAKFVYTCHGHRGNILFEHVTSH